MPRIHTIELPDVKWVEKYQKQPVIGSMVASRAGTAITWEKRLHYQFMTLAGTADTAHFTASLFEEVEALQVPGAEYETEYDGNLYICKFRTDDPPAVSGTPGNRFRYTTPTDRIINVSIKLLIIKNL